MWSPFHGVQPSSPPGSDGGVRAMSSASLSGRPRAESAGSILTSLNPLGLEAAQTEAHQAG